MTVRMRLISRRKRDPSPHRHREWRSAQCGIHGARCRPGIERASCGTTISAWAGERVTGDRLIQWTEESAVFDHGGIQWGSLGPGRGRGAATLEHDRLSFGNYCDDIVQGITFLIFAVMPNTIHHTLLLIDQHRKTGEGIVVGLSCLCEAREYISFLWPSSDPCLQARQTKPCIGLYHTPNIGVP